MPRITASHCRTNSPVMCEGRGKAADAHKVWFDVDGRTWYWVLDDLPTPVTHCAACGFPLPKMGRIVDRVIDGDTPWEPLADPDDEC